MKAFSAFFVIIGTVIGSGFMSGKEIVVFFSRFGKFSFVCIALAFFLFWLLFNFFLRQGKRAEEKLARSKFSNIINIIICTILSSAMIAGCINLLSTFNIFVIIVAMIIILLYSLVILKRGLGSLEKANFLLVPVMVGVMFGSILLAQDGFDLNSGFFEEFSPWGIFYCFLYVILNMSNSCIVLARIGQNLTSKQKARVAFFSALALCVLLFFANFVLLQNKDVFSQDMPLLSLFEGKHSLLIRLVIMLGCVTTLFSLVYTSSSSVRGLCKNEMMTFVVCLVLPLAISLCGFGNIVSFLYPLSSVLAIFLLCDLFFISLFKRAYTKIHSCRKNTK